MKKNRKWRKPKLTVLVRSIDQESVFQACKNPGSGPITYIYNQCGDTISCFACQGQNIS